MLKGLGRKRIRPCVYKDHALDRSGHLLDPLLREEDLPMRPIAVRCLTMRAHPARDALPRVG